MRERITISMKVEIAETVAAMIQTDIEASDMDPESMEYKLLERFVNRLKKNIRKSRKP